MNEQYDGWLKSSHRAVATCNDADLIFILDSNLRVKYDVGAQRKSQVAPADRQKLPKLFSLPKISVTKASILVNPANK
jgi:hypothetical protein